MQSDGQIEYELNRILGELSERMSAKVTELRQDLHTDISELEIQFLEAIAKVKEEILERDKKIQERDKKIEELEARITKIEDSSAWTLLVEDAKELGMTPEKLLKNALTDYAKKVKKQVR